MHASTDYVAYWQRRLAAEKRAEAVRWRQAWALARAAARLLYGRFGVQRVAVFGSLTHPERFSRWSDVDLAVWGLRPEDTWRALAAIGSLDPEIPIDLVDMNCCRPDLASVIENEGIPL
ncbi:hypothetical protein Rhom172_1651 [Rhodothermus marinus SG0.5JP17-172]|jgi:predicted nucleotidyltransferase|uniref:nucleotidyltransferase family protein n=1 Tax=Rhodothermus marinus TaxID=29549 RepID=UPI000223DAEA|nr:nucleotidyltransferase domain-containing protein [Rhodothermus marinus]AEN73568.1 hypothetical protein Rhom172_1651 [Rhodothermus marinus SG0.5JP17-172]